MNPPVDLLAAYDTELRGPAEFAGATEVVTIGPALAGVFPSGHGFLAYRDLGDLDANDIRALVSDVVRHFATATDVDRFEFKTRGHDRAPGLETALADAGLVAEDPESVMMGEAVKLVADVAVPDDVRVRQIFSEDEVFRMEEMLGGVFDDPRWRSRAEHTVHRLESGADMELWVAEADGRFISAGRLEPMAGTSFAGLWGGGTVPEWRGRGVYRAVTSRRAQSALNRGLRYLYSESTEFSRPILERSGMQRVTTTTPYIWRRS